MPTAAVLVPFSLLLTVGWLNWQAAWALAETEIRRAAVAAAEYGQRAFEGYNVAAGRVNDRLRGLTDEEIRAREQELGVAISQIMAELSQSEISYVIDREGRPLLATNLYPVPEDASLADREYFTALRQDIHPAVHISETFIGRFDGKMLFSVSRRRSGSGNAPSPNGFDGVVLISVSPMVLAAGLERLLPAPSDRMAFIRADGFGISTTGGLIARDRPLPPVDPASPFYDYAMAGVKSAVYISDTAMPGTESLLAMQALEGLPVYAVSMRPKAEIAAAWRAGMLPLLGFGIPATLALFLLSLQVSNDQKRLAFRNVSLQRDNALSTDRLVRANRFGLVGTFEFDVQSGVSKRSPEYMSLQGRLAAPAVETHDDWARRLHPDDRERAEREVLRVLSDESAETNYGQIYRIVTPAGDIRWIAAQGEIERDKSGRAVMLRGAHVDVTPLRTIEMALAESDARLRLAQEAMGIGGWECSTTTMPMQCSVRALQLLGLDPGGEAPRPRAALARVVREDRKRMTKALRTLRDDGSLFVEFRVGRSAVSVVQMPLWLAVRAKKETSDQTGISRVVGIVYDISERKRAEELTVLMAHEVEHRAKNALTVVSSLLRMTKAATPEEFAKVMDGRVRALSQTMGLLGKRRWQGADLRDIVENELRPFAVSGNGDGFEVSINGPPLQISVEAAQPLSMALHELATNAAKYGSLSTPGGSLQVDWSIANDEVHLFWKERGGPTIDGDPARLGFGSRLITLLFEGQIGGKISKVWRADGLVCEMSFPYRPPSVR